MKDNTNKQYREDLTQEDFEKAAQQLASQSKSVTIRGIKELVCKFHFNINANPI